ncbi:MAG: helix-turn-helix domain-containing protein [Bacteroidales bacterium]|nr:helix-turn-helix domain-containing protein [Bacteroidales bacterium]
MGHTILTITGSDGTGGSGIQADTRFISQLGGVAVSVITSITVQNTLGIQDFYDLSPEMVRRQMEAIINDLQPQVVKVGLLHNKNVVETVTDLLRQYHPKHIVYAPVTKSSQGDELLSPAVHEAIQRLLIPMCTVVLEPSDLPNANRQHGDANHLSSAVAFYLSRGEEVKEAIHHARSFMKQLPADYVEESSRSSERYNQFLDAVEQFCHHYADVAFYAEQLNVSPRYLGQVTRRFSGRSPKAIINERIIQEITTLLSTTQKPLKEIAAEMGFSSQTHLSRYFKSLKGISPSEYRQHME